MKGWVMNEGQSSNTKKIMTALVVLVVIIGIVVATKMLTAKDPATQASTDSATTSQASVESTSNTSGTSTNTATGSTYKDGTYKATADYDTPESVEEITLSVTVEGGIVTGTEISSNPSNSESKQHQTEFISGYKQLVVGKNIDSIHLSRVSGSSLTSTGFNKALEEIKTEAKA